MLDMASKTRRNISIDPDLDCWLEQDVDNASQLITDLLRTYRAYGGDEMETVRYILEKRVDETAAEL